MSRALKYALTPRPLSSVVEFQVNDFIYGAAIVDKGLGFKI
jgi:hypothetical protein